MNVINNNSNHITIHILKYTLSYKVTCQIYSNTNFKIIKLLENNFCVKTVRKKALLTKGEIVLIRKK